jgi:hypothetical protein
MQSQGAAREVGSRVVDYTLVIAGVPETIDLENTPLGKRQDVLRILHVTGMDWRPACGAVKDQSLGCFAAV